MPVGSYARHASTASLRSISFANGTRYHALGGPSLDDPPTSKRAYDACHAVVPQNISPMFVTELVSHPEMSALNADAEPNINSMLVTELVSHPEMSALNADASKNIRYMLVTELVSHPEMSALNADAP